MQRDELIKRAKITIIPFTYSTEAKNNKISFSDKFKGNEVITFDNPTDKDLYIKLIHNEHHFTTAWHYKNLLPTIVEMFHIPYKKSDFFLQNNINETGDFSCLIPIDRQLYMVDAIIPDDKKSVVRCFISSNEITGCTSCINASWFINKLNNDYHKLFKFSHTCCHILNLTNENGKTMIISGDSQAIPEISIIARYYQHIYVLENRMQYCLAFEYFKLNEINEPDVWLNCWEGGLINQYDVMNFI